MATHRQTATGISRFLDTGVTSFHVADSIETVLQESGFTPYREGPVQPGETRYLRLGGTVLAFRVGERPPHEGGILIAAAHTDSPGLQLKHRSSRYVDTLVQVPVEVYGSPILATWLDRDLTVAGRLGTVSGDVSGVQVHSPRPLAVIPNLAIHLNREVNDNLSYNRQDHLPALFGPVEEEIRTSETAQDWLIGRMAEIAGVDPQEVLEAELNLIPTEPATVTAAGLLVSPRIDNLAGCFTVMEALRRAKGAGHTQVAVFYDHEEIGSTTAFGAAGTITEQFLRRMVRSLGDASLEEVLPRTVLVSNDAAHGRHPNFRDKHDEGYAPLLGGGPVIKKSAIRRYASELPVSTWVARVAGRTGVPLQYLQNRSDIAAGSTIGPAVASRLGVLSVDLGVPILGMHSIRETGTVQDVDFMTTLITELFQGDSDEIPYADTARLG